MSISGDQVSGGHGQHAGWGKGQPDGWPAAGRKALTAPSMMTGAERMPGCRSQDRNARRPCLRKGPAAAFSHLLNGRDGLHSHTAGLRPATQPTARSSPADTRQRTKMAPPRPSNAAGIAVKCAGILQPNSLTCCRHSRVMTWKGCGIKATDASSVLLRWSISEYYAGYDDDRANEGST